MPVVAAAALVLGALAAPATAADATTRCRQHRKGRWITETISGMTLEEKVGQLFVTRVYGNTVDSDDASQPRGVRARARRAR